MADYMYSLIVAPSQISLLPENAVKARTRSILDIRNQIDISQRQTGAAWGDAWVTGDVSRLTIDNPYHVFPGQEASSPTSLTAGAGLQMGQRADDRRCGRLRAGRNRISASAAISPSAKCRAASMQPTRMGRSGPM